MKLKREKSERIVLFGKDGVAGSDLDQVLKGKYELHSFGSDWDISDERKISGLIDELKPSIIINAAAYNYVDQSEIDKSQAYRSNALGPKCLAELSSKHGSKLIHFSTNFVFDGKKHTSYLEHDAPSPLSFYGYSKMCGDHFVAAESNQNLIVRTSWIFGNNGNNFIKWAISKKGELRIVDDQYANPTYSKDLADFICWSIEHNLRGLHNFTNKGMCNKYDLVAYCFKIAGIEKKLIPAKTEEFKSMAIRPQNAALSNFLVEDVLGYKIPTWQNAIERFLKQE